MAENASLFLSYSELQNVIRWTNAQPLSVPLSIPQLALAGAGAGAITSFLLYVHRYSLSSPFYTPTFPHMRTLRYV